MPENTSTDYRLNAICPKCGELQTIVITIKSTVKEAPEEKETEGKDNVDNSKDTNGKGEQPESPGVRPADTKGSAGTKDSVPEPTDSGKNKADKHAGGKHK